MVPRIRRGVVSAQGRFWKHVVSPALNIGALATPAVNIPPLTNPLGGTAGGEYGVYPSSIADVLPDPPRF